ICVIRDLFIAPQALKKTSFFGFGSAVEWNGRRRVKRFSRNHGQRIIFDKLSSGIGPDDASGGIPAAAQNGRTSFRTMCVGGNEMNTLMTQQSFRAFLCFHSKLTGDAHRRHLDEYSTAHKSLEQSRVDLHLRIPLRVDEDGKQALELQSVENVIS